MELPVVESQEDLPESIRSVMQGTAFTDGERIFIERRPGESEARFTERRDLESGILAEHVEAHKNDLGDGTYVWGQDVSGEKSEAIYQLLNLYQQEYARAPAGEKTGVQRRLVEQMAKHASSLDRDLQKKWQKRGRRYANLIERDIDPNVSIQYSVELVRPANSASGSDGEGDDEGLSTGEGTPEDGAQPEESGKPTKGVRAPTPGPDQDAWKKAWESQKEELAGKKPDHDARAIEQARERINELEEKRGHDQEYLNFDPNDNPGQEQGLEFHVQVARSKPELYPDLRQSVAQIIGQTQRQLEMLIPRALEEIRGVENGDILDTDLAIQMISDLRAGVSPSTEVFTDHVRHRRDVYVGILLDLSGSMGNYGRIQRLREGATVLGENLTAIGDMFSMIGFSGVYPVVDMYVVKDYREGFTPEVKGRIAALDAIRENRDGAAIRWMTDYMLRTPHATNILLVISDGQPADREYHNPIEDTRNALREARARGIHTRAITVDMNASEYLDKLYEPGQYHICARTEDLPESIAGFYRKVAL